MLLKMLTKKRLTGIGSRHLISTILLRPIISTSRILFRSCWVQSVFHRVNILRGVKTFSKHSRDSQMHTQKFSAFTWISTLMKLRSCRVHTLFKKVLLKLKSTSLPATFHKRWSLCKESMFVSISNKETSKTSILIESSPYSTRATFTKFVLILTPSRFWHRLLKRTTLLCWRWLIPRRVLPVSLN